MKISAVIISFNEEKKIRAAIESVKWCDEILVVDSGSTDSTVAIAKSYGAKTVARTWEGFAKQKQFAVDQATYDWVLSLDSDEVISEKLREEILALKNSRVEPSAEGFRIPRLSIYMGRAIRHCGWYPDWQLRLFNRKRGRWKNVLIHESVEMDSDATVAKLSNDIFHYSVDSTSQHAKLIAERYAPLAARQMFRDGRSTSRLNVAFQPILKFIETYLFKLGFLDAFPGLCISYFAAHHAFLKHLLLLEMRDVIKPSE